MNETFDQTFTVVGKGRPSLFRLPSSGEQTFINSPTSLNQILQSVDDTLAQSPIQRPRTSRLSARLSIGHGPKTSEPIQQRENRRESFFDLDITDIPHAGSLKQLPVGGRRNTFDEYDEPQLEGRDARRETFGIQEDFEIVTSGRVSLADSSKRLSVGGRRSTFAEYDIEPQFDSRRQTFGVQEDLEFGRTGRPSLGATMLDDDITTVGKGQTKRRSIFYNQTFRDDVTQVTHQNNFMENTALNAVMQLQENPLIKDTENLHRDFHEVTADFQASIIFSQIKRFETALEPHVSQLRSVTKVLPAQHHKYAELKEVETDLSEELFTWRLIASLYTDRFLVAPDTESSDFAIEQLALRKQFVSEKEIIDKLFETDASLRQAQIVVDWLEQSANEVFETWSAQKLELMVGESRGWEMSLALLQRSNGNPTSNNVTELDLDAPLRQNRPLHPQDAEDFAILNQGVYKRIRCGQFSRAQELLVAAGHPLLASRLEGWLPFHDPNFDVDGQFDHEVDRLPQEGNPRRSLWKKVAWAFCDEPKIPAFERAAMGAYCGHLASLLEVAIGWLDALWAHFKVLVDQGMEKVVRNYETTTKFFAEGVDLPDGYFQKEWDIEKIFESVNTFCKSKGYSDRNNAFYIVQKYLILDDSDALVEQAELWLAEEKGPMKGHFLRFLCHMLLFLKRIGRLTSEEAGAGVIAAYVKELINSDQLGLVAWYAGELPADQQITSYAEFLEPLTMAPIEDKNALLDLAKKAGLDVKLIANIVAESTRLRRQEELEDLLKTDQEIPPLPVFQIFGLQWLLWDGVPMLADALHHSNAICRLFLMNGDLQEARTVLSALPEDIINLVKQESLEEARNTAEEDIDEESALPAREENSIREHLCIQYYLSSHRIFEDWLSVQHSKPSAPEKPKAFENRLVNHHFAEQLAYEKKERAFKMELSKWESRLHGVTESVIRRLRDDVLKFPGGWLCDAEEEEKLDQERERELDLLRKECLPQACSLLYQVFITSKKIEDIEQLEATVLDPTYRISEAFRPDALDAFLEKIRRAENL